MPCWHSFLDFVQKLDLGKLGLLILTQCYLTEFTEAGNEEEALPLAFWSSLLVTTVFLLP